MKSRLEPLLTVIACMGTVGIPYLILTVFLYKSGYLPQEYYYKAMPNFRYRDNPFFCFNLLTFEILFLAYLSVVFKRRKKLIAQSITVLFLVYSVWFYLQVFTCLNL